MTKYEAIKELRGIEARKAELEKILAEQEVDPREWIGKLCVCDKTPAGESLFILTEDHFHLGSGLCCRDNCRPATLADLEGKIYQPKKKSRYDWVEILKKYPNTKYLVSTEDGSIFSFTGQEPKPQRHGWNGGGSHYCEFVSGRNGEPCPDWRDSLEERPEGV